MESKFVKKVSKFECDEFDILILKELRENGKISIRVLSSKVGLHPNTLMQRIKRLEQEGVIRKYIAEVDYTKVGYGIKAIISIRVRMGKTWEQPIAKLKEIPEIVFLYPITGSADAIAMFYGRDLDHLAQVLRKIQATDIVLKTTTNLIVDSYKEPYEFNPFNL